MMSSFSSGRLHLPAHCYHCTLRATLLAALLNPAACFVPYFPSRTDDEHTYRWQFPQQSTALDGLGGGITWAVQGNFCEQLLPTFGSERQFNLVDCEAIMDTIVRGFATWSANHTMSPRGACADYEEDGDGRLGERPGMALNRS